MGTWGADPFGNDDALDWSWELVESDDLRVLKAALKKPEGYLEASDGSVMVAAAAVVAEGIEEGALLPDDVAQWLAANAGLDYRSLARPAMLALQRVLGQQSELRELWQENAEDFPVWKASVERLLERLSG